MSRSSGDNDDINPFNICTWDDDVDCRSCTAHGEIHCKWDGRLLAAFLLLVFPFAVAGWFGMAMVAVFSGTWWPLVVYGAFYIAFFVFFEIRILCSHCPFYARNGTTLKCLANNGALRIWKYHPEPMNRFEKISLVICFIFFGGFPVLVEAYGTAYMAVNYVDFGQTALLGMIGLMVVTLLASITFFSVLMIYVCPKCLNFSCPLNRVPKSVVDTYLENNPVMREAWESGGYRLGR